MNYPLRTDPNLPFLFKSDPFETIWECDWNPGDANPPLVS